MLMSENTDFMSESNSYKESDPDLIGIRLADKIVEFTGQELIRGLLCCPYCEATMLRKDFISNRWNCDTCGTVWTGEELLEAISVNRLMRRRDTGCIVNLTSNTS